MRPCFGLPLLLLALPMACNKAEPTKVAVAPIRQTSENAPLYPATGQASACHAVTFSGSKFTDCVAKRGLHVIRMALDGPDDQPLRSLVNLADWEQGPGNIAFALNAGMFDTRGNPIGLYVEGSHKHHALNQNSGTGNFHMLPNGVFFGGMTGWRLMTSESYAKMVKKTPDFATQSGPMLVIAGKFHPSIAQDGVSRYVRNAVGIDGTGDAHFVISEEPVSLGKLARLFRDALHCNDALYLDGFVSALWDPATGRMDDRAPLGPLLVVEKQ